MDIIIEKCGPDEFDGPRPVEMVDEDEVGKHFDIMEAFGIFRKNLHPACRIGPEYALDRRTFLCFIGRVNNSHRIERITFLHLVSPIFQLKNYPVPVSEVQIA